tara:strand:+ start:12431 stop:13015 length:585 start_codon:yes stop_codon:yes gene_type:complete
MQHVETPSSAVRIPAPVDIRPPAWIVILGEIEKKHRLKRAEILCKSRATSGYIARAELAYRMSTELRLGPTMIGRLIGRDHSSVAQSIRQFAAKKDDEWADPLSFWSAKRQKDTRISEAKRILKAERFYNTPPDKYMAPEFYSEWLEKRAVIVARFRDELRLPFTTISEFFCACPDNLSKIYKAKRALSAAKGE